MRVVFGSTKMQRPPLKHDLSLVFVPTIAIAIVFIVVAVVVMTIVNCDLQ